MNEMLPKTAFAKMAYLEEELRPYEGGYPNEETKVYYESLKAIQKAQAKGETPIQEYRALGKRAGGPTPVERGYYLANIHYYLFDCCSEFEKTEAYKAAINERIRLFLENADIGLLGKSEWFLLSFPANFRYFLELFYGRHREEDDIGGIEGCYVDLASLVDAYGNDLEKKIVESIRVIGSGYGA